MLKKVYDFLRLCFWLCFCWGGGALIVYVGALAINEKDPSSPQYLPHPLLGLALMFAGVALIASPVLYYSLLKEKNPSQKMTISFLLDGKKNPKEVK